MHLYIKHLLEDIQNAQRQDGDTMACPSPKIFEAEMNEIERYVRGEGEHRLSKLTGLKKENFPPSNHLMDKGMELALAAYDIMFVTWNREVDCPEEMPVAVHYNFMLKFVLSQNIDPMSASTNHLDFYIAYAFDYDGGNYCFCTEI